MKAEDVANYLQENPAFFEAYAQMLSDIVIPHPYGGRTISLSERQMLTLRERVKDLEKKLHELLEFAKENDGLQNKLHQFTLALFNAHDLPGLQYAAMSSLRDIFSVPHAAIHLWKEQPPICVHQPVLDTAKWFGEAEPHLRSFAYMPLRANGQTIGILIIASEDAQRFYPEMGTIFLQRIADIVGAALSQHL
ncbi:MAG: hypothetical protein FD173_1999 [Gallionellaceae bacterium]|nr:MAG: hypothetical protein FD173_1999 [Gallionellaceae bacterium]